MLICGGIMDKFSNKTENEILSLAKEGDNEAVNLIIRKYRSAVEAAAARIQNSPLDKDDLIQEGMIGLLAAIKSFDCNKGTKFSTYCFTCISNSIQTALRKLSRKKDIPENNVVPLEEEFIGISSVYTSAEDSFLAQESVSLLADLLKNNLSKFENSVLRLHMIGCSYSEIGERLGKTPKAIDNALQRIRKKLKEVSF